jgi:hypothetical protein
MANDYTPDEYRQAIAAAKAANRPDAVADLESRLADSQKVVAPTSGTESLLRGAAQGATLKFGDEIEGAVQALLPRPGEPFDPKSWLSGLGNRYTTWRDSARKIDKNAQASNPKLFTTGEVTGGALTAAVPGGLAGKAVAPAMVKAAGPLGRFINGALVGAPLGAAVGLGGSEADLTSGELSDAGKAAVDTALGGFTGGVVGGTVSAVAPPLADFVRRKSIDYGRRALSGISTPMSYTRKPIPEDAVNAAYDVGAIKPLGTVTGTAERLEVAADKQGAVYDAIVKQLEAAGVDGPSAGEIAKRLLARAAKERPVTWQKMDPIVSDLEETAAEALTKSDPGKVYTHGYDPPLDLSQSRALTGNAQRAASSEYAKIPNKVSMAGDSKMAVAGELRQAMEDAVQSQASKAPGEVAQFLPEKKKLADLLWALQEAREGAGKAARRGPLGFMDIVMAAPQVATGNLGTAAATLGVTKTLGPRISSTLGWSMRRTEEALRALSQVGQGVPALTPAARADAETLQALFARLGTAGLYPAAAGDEKQE